MSEEDRERERISELMAKLERQQTALRELIGDAAAALERAHHDRKLEQLPLDPSVRERRKTPR